MFTCICVRMFIVNIELIHIYIDWLRKKWKLKDKDENVHVDKPKIKGKRVGLWLTKTLNQWLEPMLFVDYHLLSRQG